MDRSDVCRLAEQGIAAFPPSRLPDLAAWCWDYGMASGDVRWCALWRLLSELASAWGTHMELGIPSELIVRWNGHLATGLPDVLALPSTAACTVAENLRHAMAAEQALADQAGISRDS